MKHKNHIVRGNILLNKKVYFWPYFQTICVMYCFLPVCLSSWSLDYYSDMTKIDTGPECIGKHIVLLFLHADCFVVQSFNSVAHL